jgi:hypothetical protein
LPEANTEAMNLHLAEIERHIMPDSHAVVVLDRAGWHQLGGRLKVPQNICRCHRTRRNSIHKKTSGVLASEQAQHPGVRQLRDAA